MYISCSVLTVGARATHHSGHICLPLWAIAAQLLQKAGQVFPAGTCAGSSAANQYGEAGATRKLETGSLSHLGKEQRFSYPPPDAWMEVVP